MTIELRDDVTFHNGDKMTAEDFKYTFFDRIQKGDKLDTANSWKKVKTVDIVSPTKAVMQFDSPAPTAPQWPAFLGSYIVPKDYMEKIGADAFRESRSAPAPTSSSTISSTRASSWSATIPIGGPSRRSNASR